LKKKKIIALALAVFVALPLVMCAGTQLLQLFLKQTALERFTTETIISIPLKDVNWIKKEKELLINNQYFDVKHYKVQDGQLLVNGYFDNEELELINTLLGLAQTGEEENLIGLMFFPQTLQNAIAWTYTPFLETTFSTELLKDISLLPNPFCNRDSPPPRRRLCC
jgi:hypothetical protein